MRIRTSLVLSFALLPVACGGESGPARAPEIPAASSTASAATPPPASSDDGEFALFKDGQAIGKETWHVRKNGDGSFKYEVDATFDSKGVPLRAKGTLTYGSPFEPRGADITMKLGEQDVALVLAKSPGNGPLTLTTKPAGGKEQVLTAAGPTTVFAPQPFTVGYAPLCMGTLRDDLVAFPGTAFKLVSEKNVDVKGVEGPVRAIVFDEGGLARVELACAGDKIVAMRVPFEGVVAVRKGFEAVADKLADLATRKKPAVPDMLVEEERKVQSGDAVLACSFMAPKEVKDPKAKLPAVVFATGSGPQDRDEDSAGPGGLKLSIFKTMAIELGKAGIASLRCDDRGVGASTGDFPKATLETFVGDAMAAIASLRKDPKIDPARIGMVGHSEGGIIAPLVATKDPKLKALVLMAAPGRPLAEIGVAQAERSLKQLGVSGDEAKKELDKQRAIIDAIRDGKPLPADLREDEKQAIEKQRGWLQSHFKNDPRKVLGSMRALPVFVAQGGKDTQVPPEDADAIKKLLAKNTKATVKVYPELNHLFAPAKTGTISEYADPDAKIDAGFLGDVTKFATTSL